VALISNPAGFTQGRITLPYGEADGFLPIKNSGSRIPSPDHSVNNLSILPGFVILGGNSVIKSDKTVPKYMQVTQNPHERASA